MECYFIVKTNSIFIRYRLEMTNLREIVEKTEKGVKKIEEEFGKRLDKIEAIIYDSTRNINDGASSEMSDDPNSNLQVSRQNGKVRLTQPLTSYVR